MLEILTAIAGYSLGVSQNASWDAVKYIVGKIANRSGINFEDLFVKAFMKAFEIHSERYDEIGAKYANHIKEQIISDKEILLDALRSLKYEDYGLFFHSMESKEFQRRLASEIVVRTRIDESKLQNFTVSIEAVIADVVSYYRLSLLQELSNEESDRLVLLQTLKIDEVRTLIEKIEQDFISKNILEHLLSETKENIIKELRQYIEIYTKQYNLNKQQIDELNAEAAKELFIKDIQRIILAKGFKLIPIKEPNVDIVAETKGIFSTRIAVCCEASTELTTVNSVLAFKAHFPRTNARYGYFISKSGFASDAFSEANGDSPLKLFTYDQFTNELVDFNDYIENIILGYEESRIFQYELYEPILGFGQDYSKGADLLEAIDRLFRMDRAKKIAILGDFGMGKTTLCERYHYILARRYQENPVGNRIPVLIYLRKYDRVMDIQALIVQELQSQGIDITLSICSELQRMGRFVFIFDGFDEMTLRADKLGVEENRRELEKVTQIGANRLLLTSRTHFFRDRIEEERLLGYQFLYIQEWNKTQLESYLKRSLGTKWENVRDRVTGSAALSELAKTPLFVEMIASSAPFITDDKEFSMAQLFETFTERWINEQDYRSRMTTKQKRDFMSELATLLYFSGTFSVYYSDLREVVQKTFNLSVIEDVDYFDNDTRTCSFLVRDNNGCYRFSHRSFMEYFVAKTLSREIPKIVTDIKSSKSLNRYKFHKRKLTNKTYVFLSQMNIDKNYLFQLIQATRGRTFKEIRYLGSNAASVLRYLKFDLKEADLSKCVLVDADFTGMDLTETNFKESDLCTANFNNCILDHANMQGAKLRYTSIKGLSGILDILYVSNNLTIVATMLRSVFLVDLSTKKILHKLEGHGDGVWSLASDPNGQNRFASGGRDNAVLLWDVSSRGLIKAFEGHIDNVWSISFSKVKDVLASCSSDRLIKIWTPTSSAPQATLSAHTDEVRDISFVGANSIVSCSLDKTLMVWNLETGNRHTYKGNHEFHCLAISHDERFLILGNTKGEVTILEFPSLRIKSKIKLYDGVVRTIAFAPNSYRFISGGGDGRVLLSDLSDLDFHDELANHAGFVNRVRFSNDGKVAISAGYDTLINVISVKDKNVRKIDLTKELYGASDRFSCKGLVLKDGKGLSPERLQYLRQRGAIL